MCLGMCFGMWLGMCLGTSSWACRKGGRSNNGAPLDPERQVGGCPRGGRSSSGALLGLGFLLRIDWLWESGGASTRLRLHLLVGECGEGRLVVFFFGLLSYTYQF